MQQHAAPRGAEGASSRHADHVAYLCPSAPRPWSNSSCRAAQQTRGYTPEANPRARQHASDGLVNVGKSLSCYKSASYAAAATTAAC
jgi:hypothetical protein